MDSKRKRKVIISITILCVVILFAVNKFTSSFVKNKVNHLLLKENSKYYTAHIGDVQFKILQRAIVFKNIALSPNPESYLKLKVQTDSIKALEKIHISLVKLGGIDLLKLLLDNRVDIQNLQISDLTIQKFENPEKIMEKKPLRLDSINFKSLKGLKIHKVSFDNTAFQVINLKNSKLEVNLKVENILLGGFELVNKSENLFKLILLQNKYAIKNITLDVLKNKYQFKLEKAQINKTLDIIELNKLSYKPTISKIKLANSYKFNKEVFDVEIEKLSVYNYHLNKLIQNKGHFIDSVLISNARFSIFKDKRKPYDTKRHPKLPDVVIKELKAPLYIQKIKAKNSEVVYDEYLKIDNQRLKIALNELNLNLANISSISTFKEKPMHAKIDAKINNKAPLHLDLNFDMKNPQSSYYFHGNIGKSSFKLFDSAIFPALGLKIINGDLNNLKFEGFGNSRISKGKMTLLYDNLKADVFKHHSTKEIEILSWSVNSLLHKSNPNKHGKIREVEMYTERVPYKGFANLIWKTLQSGIVNTFAPVGKISEEKAQRKHKRKSKKNKLF